MIIVDKNKCVGCGLCAKDCTVHVINLVDKKANINNLGCINCGHCIAICPSNALSTDTRDMKDVKEHNVDEFNINPNTLLNFIKFRRSIRHFKDKNVETEKIHEIIESGRFTQTGSNSQNVSYVVVKDNVNELKSLVIETLYNLSEKILSNITPETEYLRRYAMMWQKMYSDYKANPENRDMLFFNAPIVILVVSDSPVNASLASSNMELMTNALGLGTFFSGFFVKAVESNPDILKFLGLNENQKIITCMCIGYPDVKYLRTVPRNPANVSWM